MSEPTKTEAALPESQPENDVEYIKKSNRTILIDHYVDKDINNGSDEYRFHTFIRLNAKKKSFKNINFEHCVFDSCYFNNCAFDSCTFTGGRFIGSNFHKCNFVGCNFRYTVFERTQIDADILDSEAPLEENLRMRFSRSLRMNYQQLGDAKAVNKAIRVELEATSIYLYKSWSSNTTYYKKYSGFKRIFQFFKWLDFWIMDSIWGNGESALKLLRSVLLTIVFISFIDTINYHDPFNLKDYWHGFQNSSAIFFGFNIPSVYPELYIAFIASIRLTLFALFTAILVKRFNRR